MDSNNACFLDGRFRWRDAFQQYDYKAEKWTTEEEYIIVVVVVVVLLLFFLLRRRIRKRATSSSSNGQKIIDKIVHLIIYNINCTYVNGRKNNNKVIIVYHDDE